MSTDFVPGIYNYCDRWCERCAFTTRCFLFAREKTYFGDKTEHDLKSDAFWKTMQGIFRDTKTLIQRAAVEHGIDLNTLDQEELDRTMKEIASVDRQVRHDPLVGRAARFDKAGNVGLRLHDHQMGMAW